MLSSRVRRLCEGHTNGGRASVYEELEVQWLIKSLIQIKQPLYQIEPLIQMKPQCLIKPLYRMIKSLIQIKPLIQIEPLIQIKPPNQARFLTRRHSQTNHPPPTKQGSHQQTSRHCSLLPTKATLSMLLPPQPTGHSLWTPLSVSSRPPAASELRGGHRGQTRCVEGLNRPRRC